MTPDPIYSTPSAPIKKEGAIIKMKRIIIPSMIQGHRYIRLSTLHLNTSLPSGCSMTAGKGGGFDNHLFDISQKYRNIPTIQWIN